MKLKIAFLIIGAFAIMETAAKPLCVCRRRPPQDILEQFRFKSVDRNYPMGKKVEAGSLAAVGKEAELEPPERSGQSSVDSGSRSIRRFPSQPTGVSAAESSQPEYLDLDNMRFIYGNYQG